MEMRQLFARELENAMNQNENTGKQLTGQIAFTKTNCA